MIGAAAVAVTIGCGKSTYRGNELISSVFVRAAACLAVLALCGCAGGGRADAPFGSPYRVGDRVYIEMCFDGLDASAPMTTRKQEITDISIGSENIPLIARTTTDRPVYQTTSGTPDQFQTVLIKMPTTEVWAKFDRPPNLPGNIDRWTEIRPSLRTTEENAALKMLHKRKVEETKCPDLGLKASIKVGDGNEQALTTIHNRLRGQVGVQSGLKGCRELAFPLR